jgi:formate dehydrogenase maturation protein FdhE
MSIRLETITVKNLMSINDDLDLWWTPAGFTRGLVVNLPDPTQCPACFKKPVSKFSMNISGEKKHYLTCQHCAWNGEDKNPPPLSRI